MRAFGKPRLFAAVIFLGFAVVTAGATALIVLPLPSQRGVFSIEGLRDPASVDFDRLGVPHIRAKNRADAYAALGYVSGRDRLFQMDMLRRKAAGRLAEIYGADLVESDSWSRRMGFAQLSARILEQLPQSQIAVIDAYASGVNQAMRDARMWPLEIMLLRYAPEPWRAQDSLLVALNLADLSYTEEEERAATVMRAALPSTVVDFLTPDIDCYNEVMAPRAPERCASGAIPADEIAGILREEGARRSAGLVRAQRPMRGSNGWVVSRRLTRGGGSILANDMHLSLGIPNIWAQADLAYGDHRVEGLFLPGLPMIISGSNGRVAWGMTSVEGDFTDLVRLRPDPTDPGRYLDDTGASASFSQRIEHIGVRDGAPVDLVVRETRWGPVGRPLLGNDVAIKWSMLGADATNLNLIDMDAAQSVEAALPLMRSAGVPPLNALIADEQGSVGWTLMGKIPKRRGFDGLFAQIWNADLGWDGYLTSEETPQRIDPASGYIVNANQRMLPAAEFARKLGHDYSGGYRAYVIDRELSRSRGADERAMASLQLNTQADPYRYYQQLALSALDGASDETSLGMKRALSSWDGRAEADSVGLPLIDAFRSRIIDVVLSPLLARCRRLDPSFVYGWINVDTPIQQLIGSRRDDLVPPPYRNWPALLRDVLDQALNRLDAEGHAADASWGNVNRAILPHPLSAAAPSLALVLDMPKASMAGCAHCVRFYSLNEGKSSGANARLVISPGHEANGLIQMAGGQSGQFGSRHYADQQADWIAGVSHPFRLEPGSGRLELTPAGGSHRAR